MISKIKNNYLLIFSLLTIVFVSIFLNFLPIPLTEPDNILHIAYGALYKTEGLLFQDFRWESFSVFDTYKSDIWYGFHLLLSFFVVGENYLLSIQLAGAFMTSLFLLSLYFVLRKTGVKWPLVWTLFTLVSSSSQLLRFIDLRPHILMGSLSIIFVYNLSWKENKKILFLLSVLFTFSELSMLWLPICFVGLHYSALLIKKIFERDFSDFKIFLFNAVKVFSVVLSGVFLGGFLRPNPIAGFWLLYYQIFYLYWIKFTGILFPFVGELFPMDKKQLISFISVLFILGVTLIVWIYGSRKGNKDKKVNDYIWITVFSAIFFLAVSVFSSVRAVDFFTIFSFLACSVIWTNYFETIPASIRDRFMFKFAICVFLFSVSCASVFGAIYYRVNTGVKVDQYKNVADYLIKYTPKDSIVASLGFDDFPFLFIWDKHNVYLNHSDWVFLYAYNKEVATEFFCSISDLNSINIALSEKINPEKMKKACGEAKGRDMVNIFKNKMHAQYIFIGPARPFPIVKYLLKNPGVKLVYSDTNTILFKLD